VNAPTPRTPFAARAADIALDVAGVAGVGLIIAGVWRIYPPAGLIVAGVFLVAASWLIARRNAG